MTEFRPYARILASGAAITSTLLLATACDESGNPTPVTTTNTAPAATSGASTAFDPCAALTQQFLAEHQWDARAPERKQTTTGGVVWQGCAYLAQTRYSFTVQTTNGTLAQVHEKFPSATATTINGRKALRYQARPDMPGGCTVNVEMTSGSLYILVDDPRAAHPRKLSPCDNATEIAEAVVPLLPAGS
ncbi:DUF3558 domain-containing protein [Nocardia arizonensis]|uniref:DUF3558 domain-containing protein n=1 Tax=Nocardia arizonensis TaxID=1141647 RepID=UPI0006D29A28|nr:DUF3558 domain-containing protein [Nocardia arizonensis]